MRQSTPASLPVGVQVLAAANKTALAVAKVMMVRVVILIVMIVAKVMMVRVMIKMMTKVKKVRGVFGDRRKAAVYLCEMRKH